MKSRLCAAVSGVLLPVMVLSALSGVNYFPADAFVDNSNANEFWTLRGKDSSQARGPDGSEWVIEGIKDGHYHVANRWSPENGAVRSLGLAFVLDLANLKIPSKEIY